MATLVKAVRTYEDSGDGNGESWQYLVQFDTPDFTMRDARAATGVPDGVTMAGTTWTSKSSARRDPEIETLAYVTVTWAAPETNGNGEEKPIGAGVKWNLKVSSKPVAYERPVYEDSAGVALVNAAGFPFQQQPTMTDYDSTWTISFNTDDGSVADLLEEMAGRKSSDAITLAYRGLNKTFDAGTVKLTDYSFDFDYYTDDGTPAFTVTLQLDRRLDGWHDVSCENSGFYDADANRIKNTDINASADPEEDVVEAVLLDGSGYPLADGSTAVPLTFDVKAPVAFGPLLAGI
jgi:hypothetical protein